MLYPNIWTLEEFRQYLNDGMTQMKTDEQWKATRPLGYPSIGNRIKSAWLVLTGKADAVIWE